jgi:cellulose synthase/poly-beta-1,6-N-acetylglucosamine synthase-like glycosyltransferase
MWLLVAVYIVVSVALAWLVSGYFLCLWLVGRVRERRTLADPSRWPTISVVLPCFNERDGIRAKLEDLRILDYPSECLEIVVVDGGSSDGTLAELRTLAQDGTLPFRLLISPHRGKVAQLNHALTAIGGEIIVSTDVDARLCPEALRWIAREFAADDEVMVVGACCSPANCLDVEYYYWAAQNRGRLIEADAGGASIVVAPCYAFRGRLLTAFPDDVVADDVYVAFLAQSRGQKVIYSRQATVVETRNPTSYAEFVPHKFRKANAFLRESLRFIYRLPDMTPMGKVMLITRTTQQLLLPWAILGWLTLSAVLLTLFRFDVVALGFLTLLVMSLLTSRVFAWVELPVCPARFNFSATLIGCFLTTIIMMATGLSYPFFRQGSCYQRLASVALTEKRAA